MLVAILAYVVVQLLIGVLASRRIATEDDFLVAGRRIGPVLATCSIFATWFGAETCVGAAGTIHEEGLTRTSVEPFAYGVCLLITGLVFAAPFWRLKISTLADLFRRRYSPAVERLAALILIPASVLWAAAQVRAFGQVLSSASQLEAEAAIAIAAGIAVVYTAFGGLLADVYTDVVQALCLVLGLIIVLVAVTGELGGAAATWQAIVEPRATTGEPAGLLDTIEAWAIPICGSVVSQEVVSRTLAARSPTVARTATLAGAGLYLVVGLIPVALGLVAHRLVPQLDDPEHVLPALAQQHLSSFVFVVFAGALISAILSTVDSCLLVAASLLSRNVLLSDGAGATDRRRLLLARAGVVLFGIVAWALAHYGNVADLVEDASGFGSAGILVIVVFGLFTRFGGAKSAVAALLAGMGVWVWGRYLQEGFAHPYLASLGAALLAFVAVAATCERGVPAPEV